MKTSSEVGSSEAAVDLAPVPRVAPGAADGQRRGRLGAQAAWRSALVHPRGQAGAGGKHQAPFRDVPDAADDPTAGWWGIY